MDSTLWSLMEAYRFSVAFEGIGRQLSSLHPLRINVKFREEYIGHYQDRIEIQLEEKRLKKAFNISRMVYAIVGDPSLREQLKPRQPYIPRIRGPREPETRVIGGVPPPSLQAIPYVSRLPTADIPKHLLSSLAASSTPSTENVQMIQDTYLPKLFDAQSHGRHFNVLVWIEEHKMEYVLVLFLCSGHLLTCARKTRLGAIRYESGNS
jgi:helicase MOV-10